MFDVVLEVCNHSFLSRFLNSRSVVVDLGANRGEFCHGIIERFQCKVFAVEPVQELFGAIRRHPLLDLHNLAVGGKNEMGEMTIFPDRCATALQPHSPAERARKQPIEMVTLEELLRRISVHQVDLLKMDIEGAEIEIFNDSSDARLQSIMQITVEFHDFLYPEQVMAITGIKDRMRQIGFWVVPFSLDNTNVLFINRRTGVGGFEVAYLQSVVKYGRGITRRIVRQFAS